MVKKVIKKEAKAELEIQGNKLQQTNDELEKKHWKNIELLVSFEGKIKNLEAQIDVLSCKESFLCKETQTEVGLNLKCDECNFEAENKKNYVAYG